MPYVISDALHKRILDLCESDLTNYDAKVTKAMLESGNIAEYVTNRQLICALSKEYAKDVEEAKPVKVIHGDDSYGGDD